MSHHGDGAHQLVVGTWPVPAVGQQPRTGSATPAPRSAIALVARTMVRSSSWSPARKRFFAERMKLEVEPTGCQDFAAARRMKD